MMSSKGLYTSGLLIGIFSCFLAVANFWAIDPFFDDQLLLLFSDSSFSMSSSLQFHLYKAGLEDIILD